MSKPVCVLLSQSIFRLPRVEITTTLSSIISGFLSLYLWSLVKGCASDWIQLLWITYIMLFVWRGFLLGRDSMRFPFLSFFGANESNPICIELVFVLLDCAAFRRSRSCFFTTIVKILFCQWKSFLNTETWKMVSALCENSIEKQFKNYT